MQCDRLVRVRCANRWSICAEETEAITRCCRQAGSLLDPTSKMPALQYLVPLALVFEHDFPEKTNGRHAVAEQFVMKFLQREIVALLGL